MNRLRTATVSTTSPSPPLEAPPASYVEGGTASAIGGEFPSMVFAPIHYEPNYAYPLVVWLHGDGLNERQLVRLMPHVSLRNYVAVAPRGTARPGPQAGSGVASNGFVWPHRAAEAAAAETRIFDAIETAARRYHVARRRVFLAGADAGGTLALRTALAYPDRFAGALSFGGSFPQGGAPLARLDAARRLPLFIAYDGDAAAFTEERIEPLIRLFYAAGMQVMLRRYPPRKQLGGEMLADADRWMMDLVTGAVRSER
jgi:phospholipase/carboxylesterase